MDAVKNSEVIPSHAVCPRSWEALTEALENIQANQMVIYHQGNLANDRVRNVRLRDMAEVLYLRTKVKRPDIYLVQYRLEIGGFAYAAVGVPFNTRHIRLVQANYFSSTA